MSSKPVKTTKWSSTLAKLVALLIVMAVVATLAIFSVTSYQRYVIDVTRMDAQRELLGIARRMERCLEHADNATLAANTLDACVTFPQTTPEETYRITGNLAANTFLLIATPLARQARDSECGALTLSQAGVKGITGTGTREACWSVRPD